uniref:Ricin B-type lectin domain-containing protein n=1 Tax=Syphacia muris TaxID=451379 RepID=A0A0N5AYM8_9BILA
MISIIADISMLLKLLTCILYFLLNAVISKCSTEDTFGRSLFQCPNGYFLSKFNTAFDGSERFYRFSCTKFHILNSIDEYCTMSDEASTADEDIYLSCGSDQYTAGIEILEHPSDGTANWKLLCCHSDSIKIRSNDCIDTKFINDLRRSSSFSSGTQIIRKWQAMTENNDLRWWLQLCPVDIAAKKQSFDNAQPIRARRQLPKSWTQTRFAPMEYFPAYMGQTEPAINEEKYLEHKRLKMIKKIDHMQNFYSPEMPSARHTGAPQIYTSTSKATKKTDEPNEDKTAFITESATSTTPSSLTTTKASGYRAEDTAADYYDLYDDNFDRAKHEGKGGFLSGVSDLLQNLQDGLSLAQAVIPSNKVPVHATKAAGPSMMMSRDDNHLSIGIQDDRPNKHFDSMIKIQKYGPNPQRPTESLTTVQPTTLKLGDPSAIQQMLQFFGLCKGHEL